MKKALLIIPIMFASYSLAMEKSQFPLPKELIKLIDSYKHSVPAIERLRIWLSVPGNAKLDDNPLFIEALMNKLSARFGSNQKAFFSVLLGTPGSLLWLKTKLAQEKQKMLAQRGVIIESQGLTQQLAQSLIKAFRLEDEKIALSILKNFPEIEKVMPEENFLNLAASNNFVSVVQLLLSRGASINSANKIGRTPLFFAVLGNRKQLVKILLSAGANPNLSGSLDEISNVTPLMVAAGKSAGEIMSFLLEAGARVNAQDANGNTALMRALGRSGDAIILLLLNHGSDLEIKNKEGNTALQIAIRYLGRIDVIQELLNRGALISEAVLETAQQLPDDGYKKSVLQILQEKQENPGKIFGKDCLYKKL